MPDFTSSIKVDLDQEFSPCRWGAWCDKAAWILGTLGLRVGYVQVDRTNRGYHVRITARPGLPNEAVVALQAMLGSDWHREAFNLKRVLGPTPGNWNVLFHEKRPLHHGALPTVEVRDSRKERVLLDSIGSMREEVNQRLNDHLSPHDSDGGHAEQPSVGDFPEATRPTPVGAGVSSGHASPTAHIDQVAAGGYSARVKSPSGVSGKVRRTPKDVRTLARPSPKSGSALHGGQDEGDSRTEPVHGPSPAD